MSVRRRTFLHAGLAATVAALLPGSAALADYWVPPQPYSPPNPGSTPSLADWLASHSVIADSIIWQRTDGVVAAYRQWPQRDRDRLAMYFHLAFQGLPSGLPLFPANVMPLRTNAFGISANDARDFYMAYVGHMLAIEVRGDLAWSLTSIWNSQELEILFDGRQYFELLPDSSTYGTVGRSTLAPPDYVYGFLRANQMLGPAPSGATDPSSARKSAYTRLVSWCGDKMSHFTGSISSLANADEHWHYRGPPPVARVISGTVNTSFSPLLHHFTAGCIGTTAFLRSVARAMNLAVEIRVVGTHTAPRMMADDLYLTHGDDPYRRILTLSTAPVPASLTCPTEELFIDGNTYFDWFFLQFSPSNPNKNVGRRSTELAAAYLPLGLLDFYLQDQQHGYSHANGTVAAALASRYSLDELEQMQLWQQMDSKIAAHGGPAGIAAQMAKVTAEKHV